MNATAPTMPRQGPSLSMLMIGMGLAMIIAAYITYLRPEFRVQHEFIATQCTILDKQLIMMEGRGGELFRPEFRFRYDVQGASIESTGYDIVAATSSGREFNEAILNEFQVGGVYPCWYDPAAPSIAVLVRHYSTFGFVLVGLGGLLCAIGLVGII